MRANSAIAQSLPIVLASIAEQSGLTLGIGGSSAYTNGKHVQVPSLPLDCSEKTAMLAYGYLYHEGSHVRYTDFSALDECVTPLARKILNILEDGRIEQRMGREFPGARLRLDGLSKLIDVNEGASLQDDPSLVFINHVFLHVLVAELGRTWVEPCWHENRQKFEQIFGKNLMIKVEALIAGTSKRATTASLVPTVYAIVECLEKAKNQVDSQDGDDQQQGGGQDGDDQQQGSGQDGDDQDGGDQQQGGGQANTYSAIIQQVLDATEDDLGEDRDDQIAKLLQGAAAAESGVQISMLPVTHGMTEDAMYTPSAEVSDSVRQLRYRLRALLQANNKTRHSVRESGSRIASSRLWRLETGRTDVFRHKTSRKGLNTAIELLLDESGSMAEKVGASKSLYNIAVDSAYAMAEAVESIKGVSTSVSAFPYYGEDESSVSRLKVKQYGESLRQARNGFGAVLPNGTTPMAEALMSAAVELYLRDEDRKILICATDGEPDDALALHEVVREIEKMGIELVGIGIKHNGVGTYFRDHLVIQTVQEMPQKLMETLQRLLD